MAEVDVFLKEEWPALGDSEILKKQLKQCRVRFLYDTFHMKTFIWKILFSYIDDSEPGAVLSFWGTFSNVWRHFHLSQLGVG